MSKIKQALEDYNWTIFYNSRTVMDNDFMITDWIRKEEIVNCPGDGWELILTPDATQDEIDLMLMIHTSLDSCWDFEAIFSIISIDGWARFRTPSRKWV